MSEPRAALHRRRDWFFPLLLLVPLAWTLWLFSGPGVPTIPVLAALAVLSVFGLTWLGLVYSARRGGRPLTWYGVAAALTTIVFLLVMLQVPRHARWAASQQAFDLFAAEVAANPHAPVPPSIGWYDVDNLRHVDGGWIIYETTGSGMLDDAGFAYLPAGPTNSLGDGSWENPRFVHLGGPWYTWTASW